MKGPAVIVLVYLLRAFTERDKGPSQCIGYARIIRVLTLSLDTNLLLLPIRVFYLSHQARRCRRHVCKFLGIWVIQAINLIVDGHLPFYERLVK